MIEIRLKMVISLWSHRNEVTDISPSVLWLRCPVSLGDQVMQTNTLPVWTCQVGYKLPLDCFTSLCHSAQALGWAWQGSKPPSCSVQAVTACPDIVPLPSHLWLVPTLAIKAKCAGTASVGPLFSREVDKNFLSSSSSFPWH